jgi:mono/diheme cytochrome c family protein
MALTRLAIALGALCVPYAAYAAGNADAGRQLVTRSCTSCHAATGAATATDGAPPLSFLARDNKENPTWVRGWLKDPHPPMPGIMLSRQQIDDIVAYLNMLSNQASIRIK